MISVLLYAKTSYCWMIRMSKPSLEELRPLQKKGDTQAALQDYTTAQALEPRNKEIGSAIESLRKLVKCQNLDNDQGNGSFVMSFGEKSCKEVGSGDKLQTIDDLHVRNKEVCESTECDVQAYEDKKRKVDKTGSEKRRKMMKGVSFNPLGIQSTNTNEENSVKKGEEDVNDGKVELGDNVASQIPIKDGNQPTASQTHTFFNTKKKSSRLTISASDMELLA